MSIMCPGQTCSSLSLRPWRDWGFAKVNALQGAEGSGELAGLRLDNMYVAAGLLLHLLCKLDGICIWQINGTGWLPRSTEGAGEQPSRGPGQKALQEAILHEWKRRVWLWTQVPPEWLFW